MDPNNAEDNSFESIDANHAIYPGRNNDDDEQGFDLKALKVKNEFEYPLSLDITAEIQNILAAGVFKNLESPILYEKLCHMMLSDRYLNLVEGLFWTIFVVKYQKNDVELLERFRRQLGRLYSEYFSLLQQPKEELSNLGIFGGAYIAHVVFFNIFPKIRDQFDMRFILDCYHIVIHEVNGVFVSDFYIQSSIEKIFGNKFFHYEKLAQKKKKVEKKDFRNEPLLRDLQFNLDDLPQVPGGLDLAYELSAKLRRAPKKHKAGTLNELNDSKSTHSVAKSFQQPILKLTQPEEKSMISSTSDANRPYFPKLKFNCHQISPTVSGFLDNSTHTLPFQKKKVINYSNNKNVTEGVHMTLPTFETEPDTKSEKKDKKQGQQKWTTADYKLNNRNEDYYLGYMPKDIKKKFKVELDMKYIFDNIKPVLRGSYSLKPLSDGYFNKYQPAYSYGNTPQEAIKTIKEEQEEDPRDGGEEIGLERQETELNRADISMKERREDNIEDLNISKNFRTVEDEGCLPLIRSKTKSNRDDSFNINRRGSLKKSNLLPKIQDEINMTVDAAELKKTFTSPSLKYSTAANKKLGKGRFFVSLKDYKEDDPDQEDPQVKYGKYRYTNKRLHYIEEHDRAIRKDVDANIENLIDRLMSKKSSFKRSFKGKI